MSKKALSNPGEEALEVRNFEAFHGNAREQCAQFFVISDERFGDRGRRYDVMKGGVATQWCEVLERSSVDVRKFESQQYSQTLQSGKTVESPFRALLQKRCASCEALCVSRNTTLKKLLKNRRFRRSAGQRRAFLE